MNHRLRGSTSTKLAVTFLCCLATLSASSLFVQTNLTSDIPGMAANTDPNLKNPWGMSFGTATPFWVSNQRTNTSTLYNAAGVPQSLVVTTPASPTGQVFNTTSDFTLAPGTPARFLFSSLSGTISGWNPAVNPTAAVTEFLATDGAVYTGLAIGSASGGARLYAADARNGKIDVLDSSFHQITLSGSFTDPTVPSGYTPYNIQNIGDKLYVTYAKRENPGGFIGVFDLDGAFVRHISDSHLEEPWGLTMAPAGFGEFGGALLVGNEGDGRINAFDPSTGVYLGTLSSASGPIENEGLWAIGFRASGTSFDSMALYFTAGINDEQNGLFGTISPAQVPEPATVSTAALAVLALGCLRKLHRTK